jgi:hypothetical protein
MLCSIVVSLKDWRSSLIKRKNYNQTTYLKIRKKSSNTPNDVVTVLCPISSGRNWIAAILTSTRVSLVMQSLKIFFLSAKSDIGQVNNSKHLTHKAIASLDEECKNLK